MGSYEPQLGHGLQDEDPLGVVAFEVQLGRDRLERLAMSLELLRIHQCGLLLRLSQ
jgi:hypothetical protein